MGISLLGASTGLSASDLISQPDWKLLGSYTTNSANAGFTISNLPQTYRTLKIICPRIYQPANVTGVQIRLNGSTSSIYNYVFRQTSNAGAEYSDPSTMPKTNIRFPISMPSYNHAFCLTVENYSSATDFKLFKGWTANESSYVGEVEGYFASNTAITSIDFYADTSTINVNNTGSTGLGLYIWGTK